MADPLLEPLDDVLSGRGQDMKRCANACIDLSKRGRARLTQVKDALRDELSQIALMLGEDGTAEYLDDASASQLMVYRDHIERAHNEVIAAYEALTTPSV